MKKYAIFQRMEQIPLAQQFSLMLNLKSRITSSIVNDIELIKSPLYSYVMIKYDYFVQVVDLNLCRRYCFNFIGQPEICSICLDMLIFTFQKDVYLHDLRLHKSFIKAGVLEGTKFDGVWQMQKNILFYTLGEDKIKFSYLDEVKNMQIKGGKQIKFQQQQERAKRTQSTADGLFIYFQKSIKIITNQTYQKGIYLEMNASEITYLPMKCKTLVFNNFFILYHMGQHSLHFFKMEKTTNLHYFITIWHQLQIVSIQNYDDFSIIVEDKTGSLYQYNIPKILRTGLVQPFIDKLFTQTTENQDIFFLQKGNIIKLSIEEDTIRAHLIHESFSFPTIKQEKKIQQSTFMSLQSDLQLLLKEQEYAPYIDFNGNLNLQNYFSEVLFHIKKLTNNFPLLQKNVQCSIFQQIMEKLHKLIYIFKGDLRDLESNNYYWKLTSIYYSQKGQLKKCKQNLVSLIKQQGIELILNEFKMISFLIQQHKRCGLYAKLIQEFRQISSFFYPSDKFSTNSSTIAYLLYQRSLNKIEESGCKLSSQLNFQQASSLQINPQNLSPLPTNNTLLQRYFQKLLKNYDLRYFLRKVKEQKFDDEDVFNALQFAYDYFCRNCDDPLMQNIERQDAEQMFELMLELSRKIEDKGNRKSWIYLVREGHRFEKEYEAFIKEKRIKDVLLRREYWYSENEWKKIKQYLMEIQDKSYSLIGNTQ